MCESGSRAFVCKPWGQLLPHETLLMSPRPEITLLPRAHPLPAGHHWKRGIDRWRKKSCTLTWSPLDSRVDLTLLSSLHRNAYMYNYLLIDLAWVFLKESRPVVHFKSFAAWKFLFFSSWVLQSRWKTQQVLLMFFYPWENLSQLPVYLVYFDILLPETAL